MRITLTTFFPIWALSKIEASEPLKPSWNGSYENVKVKNQSYCYPFEGGSGQKIQPLKLLPNDVLLDSISALDDGRMGLIYALVSTTYPILYVGITQGTIRKGIFGTGRLGHHIRKLFACHSTHTSHTEGWTSHAIERYRDRMDVYQSSSSSKRMLANFYGTLVGGDLLLAFGSTDGHWDPADYEGTVLKALDKSFKTNGIKLHILNSKSTKMAPASIAVPDNIDINSQFISTSLEVTPKNKLKNVARNEVWLDIESLANYCDQVDSISVENITFCISGRFKKLWEDQWHERILEMASEWSNIETVCATAINVARRGNHLNNKIVSDFHEIFRIYESATRIMLRNSDDGYEWKLEPIEELKELLIK